MPRDMAECLGGMLIKKTKLIQNCQFSKAPFFRGLGGVQVFCWGIGLYIIYIRCFHCFVRFFLHLISSVSQRHVCLVSL